MRITLTTKKCADLQRLISVTLRMLISILLLVCYRKTHMATAVFKELYVYNSPVVYKSFFQLNRLFL